MKRWREGYQNIQHTRKIQYNSKICYLGVFKERLGFFGAFKHTAIKLQNTCNIQLAGSITFKYLIPNSSKIGNKSFIMLLL